MTYQPRPPSALPGLKARNPRTQALIRRDTIWQIGVPLGVAVAIVLGLMIWLVVPFFVNAPVGVATASVWADVSLIFLIVIFGFMGLVILALVGGLVYGAGYLLGNVPSLFKRLQDLVVVVAYRVTSAAEKVTNAAVATRSFMAGVNRAAGNVRSAATGWRRSR